MDETQKLPALTAAQYWEWRTTICDVELASQKLVQSELELKLLFKETELLAVKSQLHKVMRVENLRAKHTEAIAEYQRYKKVLEDSLGVSLSNKIIDEITFEVKDLPSENQQLSAKAEGEK